MSRIAMGSSLKEHWRAFLLAISLGIALPLITSSWTQPQTWFRAVFGVKDGRLLVGIALAAFAILIVTWRHTVHFWRRYRRTQQLERPPLPYIEVIAIGLICCVLTFIILNWSSLIQAWHFDTSKIIHRFSIGGLGVLLVACFLSVLAWFCSEDPVKTTPISKGSSDGDFLDEPIQHDEQDLLGRISFIEGLYQQIIKIPRPHSFAFGLYGKWGEGKTSVLHLLQHRLKQEQDPSMIPVWFNPWYLASEAALIQSFYTAIEQALRQRYLVVGLRRILSRYGEVLTSGLGSLGVKLSFRNEPERLRQELETWIGRTGCRLVILIDDIDRLPPAEVLAVFKLVGLSARLQNAVFVLSFDPTVIENMLRERVRVDPAFLEKIVQKPLQLPLADQQDLDRFLLFSKPEGPEAHRSSIDQLLDRLEVAHSRREAFHKDFDYFYVNHLKRLFRTIRDVKRYLNSLGATLPAVINEVQLCDFFLLEAIQVFAPQVYQDIWSNRWFYVPPWSQELSFLIPRRLAMHPDEKRRAVHEHVTDLLKDNPRREVIQAILEEIFSVVVGNAFQRAGSITYHDNAKRSYREEQRITHPECFVKYFLFKIPRGELADEEIKELITAWNEESEKTIGNRIANDLRHHREAGTLPELLSKLMLFNQHVTSEQVPVIVRALYQCIPQLSRTREPWQSEYERAEELILRLVEDRADPADISPVLEDVVSQAEPLHFVVLVVRSCHHALADNLFRISEQIDLRALRRIAAGRLQSRFIEGKRDIFAELPDYDWRFVLFQWGTDWGSENEENRIAVCNYVMGLIDKKPEYLGQLLRCFHDVSREAFRLNEFIQLYDPAAINECIERHGLQALNTSEAQEAAQLFQRSFAEYEA